MPDSLLLSFRRIHCDDRKDPRAAQLYAERLTRLTCHQIHTVGLLANARIRNKWINDRLLHVRRYVRE